MEIFTVISTSVNQAEDNQPQIRVLIKAAKVTRRMPDPSDPIEDVINRAKNGDSTAISELYQTNVDRIYRYVAYRVPDSEAEDITADVFMKMVTDIQNYTYRGIPFEAWLYSIARSRVADFHRRRKQNVEMIDEQLADRRMQPEERIVQSEEYADIKSALSSLTELEQEILILRFVERLGHDKVAEITGKSISSVRTTQHRALHKLAQKFSLDKKEYHYLRGETRPENETEETD